MSARITKSTEYVRYVFTDAEKLQMGADLAASHNRLAAIDEEEQVIKAKFKERRSTIEQSVGSLSRDLGTGWTMQNVECRLDYDSPNVGEVSYIRLDTNEVVKTRAMTQEERQMDLPLDGEVVVVPPEKSEENIKGFFDSPKPDAPPEETEEAEEAEDPYGDEDDLDPDSEPVVDSQLEDSLLEDAYDVFLNCKKVSAIELQRVLSISYVKAAHIIDALEAKGKVSKPDENGVRSLNVHGEGPKKSGPKELAEYHEQVLEAEASPVRHRGRPKGSTNKKTPAVDPLTVEEPDISF